jgi:hypothetical protein
MKRQLPLSVWGLGARIGEDCIVIGHLSAGRIAELYQVWSTTYLCALTCKMVAYLRAAANVSRLLPIWLRGVNQPVIRSRNPFSSPHLTRLAYI